MDKEVKNILFDTPHWKDWKIQQRNSIKDIRALKEYFPNVNPELIENMHDQTGERLKFQITPYILSQIPRDISQEDFIKNPWVMQFFPLGEIYNEGHDAYDGTDNWEDSREFPTSNLHHKYENRALIRFRNCLGYCNFCFEALGILEKNPSEDKHFNYNDWEDSLEYLKEHPKIEEVVFSGGEPLLNSDSRLEQLLGDVSEIYDENGKPKIRFKRIHTRAFTINPFRITNNLAGIMGDYRVNEIALDVAHPSEFTPEFKGALDLIREIGGKDAPMVVMHTPLIKGLNNNSEVLWDLFGQAYEMNIKPYYLLHSMPHTPFADKQRVPVQEGVELLRPLWRAKSHIAIPEYVIVHKNGKHTIPLEINGTPEFQYTQDTEGNPIIKFKNYKDEWCEYPDAKK